MHRDPGRGKCQALPFGKHREHQDWPNWITVKDEVKIVGAIFSNKGDLEKLNGSLVSKCFFDELHKSYGVKGTILQKVYYVNTYLFSKIWYTAQCFKLEKKMLENLLMKALKFVYAGQNERPVRSVNFRGRESGGLGLVNPVVKAKALLLKSMYREFVRKGGDKNDVNSYINIYGYTKEFTEIITAGVTLNSSLYVYQYLNEGIICKNNSIIPSRNEKWVNNVKWRIAWRNWRHLKGMDADEIEFAWKMQQDLLVIGSRIHRQNAERRCLAEISVGNCQEIETLKHRFTSCEGVEVFFMKCKNIIEEYLERGVSTDEIIYLSFNHRDKKRLCCALWFAVKAMYKVYQMKYSSKSQILRELVKEIDWNLELNRKIGSFQQMQNIKSIIEMFL